MSGFGQVVDPSRTSVAVAAEPEPSFPGERAAAEASIVRRPRSQGHGRATDPLGQWEIQAQDELKRAVALAEDLSESPIAHARCAQAYEQVGNIEAAVRSATRSLSLIGNHANSTRFSGTVFSCIQLLLSYGKFDIARGFLSKLPKSPSLEILDAEILIQEGETEKASAILQEISGNPRAEALLGYIHLVNDAPDVALREFRRALSKMGNPDFSIHKNMAICYWKLGSFRKGITSARMATIAAPGRRDASRMLLDFLIDSGRTNDAKREIKRLQDEGFVEDSTLLLMQARLAAESGDHAKLRAFLSKARIKAQAEDNGRAYSTATANLKMIEFGNERATKKATLRELEELLHQYPSNGALFKMISDLCWRTTDLPLLQRSLDLLKSNGGGAAVVAMGEAMVANLGGRFLDAAERAREWMKLDPLDASAASIAITLHGHATEKWDEAAVLARQALSVTPRTEALVNSAAYALALGGDPRYAVRILRDFGTPTYVLQATLGLALLSVGDVASGLAEYRKAADLADRERDKFDSRALMTQHQAAGLLRLGIARPGLSVEIQAGALPHVNLPADWEENPAFTMLKWVADRNSWDWPLSID